MLSEILLKGGPVKFNQNFSKMWNLTKLQKAVKKGVTISVYCISYNTFSKIFENSPFKNHNVFEKKEEFSRGLFGAENLPLWILITEMLKVNQFFRQSNKYERAF